MATDATRRCGDGRRAAEVSERGVAAEPVGVVTGGDEELAGNVGADAVERDQVRGHRSHERSEDRVEFVQLGGELLIATSDRPQRDLGRFVGIGRVGGTEPGGPLDQLAECELAELVSEPVIGGGHQTLQLLGGLRAGLERGSASDPQRPDALDPAGASLRDTSGGAGLHGSGGGFGVDRVGLAPPVTGPAVGPINFEHPIASRSEVPGDARTPRAGAFDAERVDRPEPTRPPIELAVPARGGRERLGTQQSTTFVEHYCDVGLTVRVDPDRDARLLICDRGHRHPFCLVRGRMARTAGTTDTTVMGACCRRLL